MACEFVDLVVSPNRLDFEAEEGTRYVLPRQTVFIKKAESGLSPRWVITISGSGDWIEVKPMSGKGEKKLRVRIDPREVDSGVYKAKITVMSQANTVVVDVTLTVGDGEPDEMTARELKKKWLDEFADEFHVIGFDNGTWFHVHDDEQIPESWAFKKI